MKNIIAVVTIVILFLSSCANRTNEMMQESSVTQKQEVIYDIPSLKGKNIDEVVKILGTPEVSNSEPTKAQISAGVLTWEKEYRRNGYELLITYYIRTRKVVDFFIPTNDPSGKTKNYKDLLQISNTEDQSEIYIEPVKTFVDSSSYTGIKIILL